MTDPPLDPLAQRLFLYGFAVVEMDPRVPVAPHDWALPGLQLLLPNNGSRTWRRIFGNCASYSEIGGYPVVSPSLSWLRRIRRRDPLRPLILCRPAFSSTSKVDGRGLAGKAGRWRDLGLRGDDSLMPLFWLGEQTPLRGLCSRTVAAFPYHPVRQRFRALLLERPRNLFWVDECGAIFEQPDLFERRWAEDADPVTVAVRQNYGRFFHDEVSALAGRWCVCAADEGSLKWFWRDVVRWLGPNFQCFPFPQLPDPRDPRTCLVLVADRKIVLGGLPIDFGLYHLGGDDRVRRFRELRAHPPGKPTWSGAANYKSMAWARVAGRRLGFCRTASGWTSWMGANDELPDETQGFEAHLHYHRFCRGRDE